MAFASGCAPGPVAPSSPLGGVRDASASRSEALRGLARVECDVVVPSHHRMRRSVDFATAVRRGRRVSRRTLALHLVLTGRSEPARVGFVVSRAVGNAVVRNTVRRRLRHLMRERLTRVPTGTLLVVRALPSAAEATSERLGREIDTALEEALARPRYLAAESAR